MDEEQPNLRYQLNPTDLPPNDGQARARYVCRVCGADRFVVIPPKSRSVDTKIWVQLVTERIYRDHAIAKSGCTSDKVDVLIPYDEEGRAGFFTEQTRQDPDNTDHWVAGDPRED